MKKQLVILFATFLSMNAFGQTDQKFHFGLKAIPTLAWIKSDTKTLTTNGSKIGFAYGLITEFNFGKNYAFATGLEVSYRGGKSKFSSVTPGLTTVTETTYNLEYIEVPLTLKFKTNEIGAMTYYLQAGLQPGFNIRSRADEDFKFQSNGTTKDSSATDIDISDHINTFNLSMIIGGGLEYNLSGNTSFLAGITFSNGLLDILDDSNLKARSNYLGLNLGILF